MEMKGEQLIPASQKTVWDALNNPEILKACVPGCESITPTGSSEFEVLMVARVGPVSAKFKGKLALSDIQPPKSYSLSFEGQGGAAGFAKGSANVQLGRQGMLTKLSYDVKASVGGKLAQIGSRLVDAAARKVAADFFKNFNDKVGDQAPEGGDAEATVISADTTVITKPEEPAAAEKAGHDDHAAGPVPRDPDLPSASNTTLAFFAAGVLVVFIVALFVLI